MRPFLLSIRPFLVSPSRAAVFAWGALCLAPAASVLAQDANPIRILRPAPRSIVTTNSLILEAEAAPSDDSVLYMEFRASYFTAGYNSRSATNYFQYTNDTVLYADSTAPYQWIWDISGVQDHYHGRMSVRFRAVCASGRSYQAVTSDFVVDRNADTTPKKRAHALHGARFGSMQIVSTEPAYQILNGDNAVTFQTGWTRDSLLLLFVVDDAAIEVATDTGSDGGVRWWNGDAMEVFVDTRNTRSPLFDSSMYQVVATPEGEGSGGLESFALRGGRFDVGITSRMREAGYTVRCAAAWSDLGVKAPVADDVFGFEVTNVDLDKAGGLFTHGTLSGLHLGNHHNASEWGVLVLDPPTGPSISSIVLLAFAGVAIVALLVLLVRTRHAGGQPGEPQPPQALPEDIGPLTQAVIDLVAEEYGNDKLNLQYVASSLHKNPKYLSTVFKKEAGTNFTSYLNRIRLEKANDLLQTTDLSISYISLEVGYGSYKYFSAVYRKHFGVAPSEVRGKGRREPKS